MLQTTAVNLLLETVLVIVTFMAALVQLPIEIN